MRALAEQAAQAAGEWILSRRPQQVDHKGAVDLVTEVDLGAEERIRAILERSGIPVLAEEGGGASEATTRWIVDPLDGTTNFVHAFPHYAVSIALQVEGELEVGVVLELPAGRLFSAQRGQGATCDGEAISVSNTPTLDRALVASGFAYDRRERPRDYLRFVERMLVEAQGFRRAGAAALDLAYVACGYLDGFWEFNLSPWDVAAGTLLVREAGGLVSDIDGGALALDRPRILASNGHIHRQMIQTLSPLLPLASQGT